MARNTLLAVALLGVLVAGCGGDEELEAKQAADARAQIAQIRARHDSLKQARAAQLAAAAADSAAPADSTAPADSAAAIVTGGDTTPASTSLASRPAVTAPAAAGEMPGGEMPARDSLPQAAASDAEAPMGDPTRAKEIEVLRETFAYAGGARDPFASLINMNSNVPEVSDLDLVGVYLDLRTPSNDVVVLREKAPSGKRHKMRVGDQLGRARLTEIRPRDAVFMIEDFGYERQETLSLRKQEVETP